MAQDLAEVCPAPGSAEECPEPGPHGSKSTSEPETLQRFGQTSAYEVNDQLLKYLKCTSDSTCAEAGRFLGSHWSRSVIRWMASGLAFGISVFRLLGTH